jgi:chloramphenicol O-acetyltransferase
MYIIETLHDWNIHDHLRTYLIEHIWAHVGNLNYVWLFVSNYVVINYSYLKTAFNLSTPHILLFHSVKITNELTEMTIAGQNGHC